MHNTFLMKFVYLRVSIIRRYSFDLSIVLLYVGGDASLAVRRTSYFFGMSETILSENQLGSYYLLPFTVGQGRRNVTQSEGASKTSIPSRVKTNLSTMDFYADLCFPRPGESFSV